MNKKLISLIIPVFNEGKNIPHLYDAIIKEWQKSLSSYELEMIFVDDGSSDHSMKVIHELAAKDERVRFIEFSRNFGKEVATTAGIHDCRGDACIMMDADLQHPVEILAQFIKKWNAGAEVVIGVRKTSKSDSWIKKTGGKVFYSIMKRISDVPVIPQATDYRLLDRMVIDAFNELPERNRMTRGLIDWLGFQREIIYFDANDRLNGEAQYSTFQLFRLAFTSFISLSMLPLRITGYLGIFIVLISVIFGIVIVLDRYFMEWDLHFSGSVILADLIVFLIGIVLISLGLLAFYIANIYHETQGRPLYVVRKKR